MTILTLDSGNRYGVEFRHRTKKLSPQQIRRPGFGNGAPVKAITVCVITALGQDITYMGIGTAVCVMEDQFSRRKGMEISFTHAVFDCSLLDKTALLAAFDREWPRPARVSRPTKKAKPTPEEIAKLKAAGAEIRGARAAGAGRAKSRLGEKTGAP